MPFNFSYPGLLARLLLYPTRCGKFKGLLSGWICTLFEQLKKNWRVKGVDMALSSSIQYEKFSILEAFDSSGLLALQMLRSGNSSSLTVSFLRSIIAKVFHDSHDQRRVIFFLDKGRILHAREIIEFAKRLTSFCFLTLRTHHHSIQ